MRLLVVRHAIAVERATWAARGREERLRPLTDVGRARFRKAAPGLLREVPRLDLLATSPMRRASDTAAILASVYGKVTPVERDELAPDADLASLSLWLAGERPESTVAIVGHEPGLSRLCGWLLAGEERSFVELRKGGACLLDLPRPPGPGAARLLWLFEPRQLRRLGK